MIWDQVMARVAGEVTTDAVLLALYGDTLIMAGTQQFQVPSIEWSLISDTEQELWAPMIIQFDIWAKEAEVNRRGEFRLRALYHKDLPVVLSGDLMMWTQFADATTLPVPDRAGIFGRSLRFRMTPLRRQYALPGVAVV